jgi:hypothetical protein
VNISSSRGLSVSVLVAALAGCSTSGDGGQDRGGVKVLVLAKGNGTVTSTGREPLDCQLDGSEQACNWSFDGSPELIATAGAEWRFVQWRATDVEIVGGRVQGRAGVPIENETAPRLTRLDASCRKRDPRSLCNNYIINAIFEPVADGGK